MTDDPEPDHLHFCQMCRTNRPVEIDPPNQSDNYHAQDVSIARCAACGDALGTLYGGRQMRTYSERYD
jgi:hypothetical protein